MKYILKHWKVISLGYTFTLEGHLYNHPKCPDGILIQTSAIRTWTRSQGQLLFQTFNNTYLCALDEMCIIENALAGLGEPSFDKLPDMLREKRCRHYHVLLPLVRSEKAVFMSWGSSPCPFLRWIVYAGRDKTFYVEGSDVSSHQYLTVDKNNSIITGCRELKYQIAPDGFGRTVPVIIENTGPQDLTIMRSDSLQPLCIRAGSFAVT